MVRLHLGGIKYPKCNQRPCPKLNPLWYGPFKVIGRPTANSCKLELPVDSQIHDTFPVSRLKRASAAEFSNMDETAPPVLEDEDSAYGVASILDHADRQDGRYYLIQWNGVQPLHHYRATWEPRSHLDGASAIRDAYERTYPLQAKTHKKRAASQDAADSKSTPKGDAKKKRRRQGQSSPNDAVAPQNTAPNADQKNSRAARAAKRNTQQVTFAADNVIINSVTQSANPDH